MSWFKKMISLLFGDEEETETDAIEHQTKSHQEHQSVKNVLSDPKTTDGENRQQIKAEARVSYQYPKGNFRFPIIPDERHIKRVERPRRKDHQENNQRKQPEKKTQDYKSFDRYKQAQESAVEKKEIVYANKRPFHPTAIPSPVYGFQPRDERIKKRPIHLENHRNNQEQQLAGETKESGEEKITSIELEESYETNHVVEHVHRDEEQPAHLPDDQLTAVDEDEDEDTSLTFEIDSKEINAEIQLEEEDFVDEALTIVKTEYQKQLHDDQVNLKEITKHEEQAEYRYEENEAVIELEESPQEGEQHDEKIHAENTILVEQSPSTKADQTESMKQEKLDSTNHSHSENTPRRKSAPFNVMMLGRDKQKLREKSQEHGYQFPSLNYLNVADREVIEDHTWLESQKDLLNVTLKNFNVRASVVNVTQGPSVTRFEVHPEPGVKVNKITNLSDDIKLSLSAKDIRIEAPIPGKNTIGIEVPNKVSKMVYLREILRSTEFRSNPSPMTAVLGLDIAGQPAVTDLKKMPHGLIAGATGSGKSVCINTILISLLYKASPHEVKLMLIDPKMVELAPYNEIPHLVSPVITDVKAATAALKWAVEEMERRYELFAHSGTREITRYNQLVKEHKQGEHLPYLVIIIDELADLMMVAPNDVEEAICRIAQKARACGIHLIVATQRPSVDVITGLIKANIPTRIAFSVSSQVDSRTIIDVNGAEKLLGKGDMLFLENGSSKAVRLQGTFVSDEEIERVVKHVKLQSKPDYLFHQDELVKKATIQSEEDELFLEACEFVVNQGGASTSSLQRRFRIGYNRAARLIDMMEEQGIISENRGSKPRDVLISEEELDAIHETHVL